KDPKAYWPQTKMPNLRLSDREAGSIAKWLAQKTGGVEYAVPAAFRPEFPKERLATLAAEGKALIAKKGCFGCHDIRGSEAAQKPRMSDPSYLAGQSDRKKADIDGERLVAFYGCRNCHILDGEGGRIRDRYPDDLVGMAPPILTGEGAKTQPGWLFGFLKAPR